MKKIITFMFIFFFFSSTAFAATSLPKDNVLIYVNQNGTARGYNLLWKAEDITGTYFQKSNVARKDDVVYLVSTQIDGFPGNRDLFALDAYTGEIIDSYEIGPTLGDILIIGTTLYIGTGDEDWSPDSTWTGDNGVWAFDISNIRTTGFAVDWFREIPNKVAMNLAFDNNNLYFSEFFGSNFRAITQADGGDVWSFPKGNIGAIGSIVKDGFAYFTNTFSGSNLFYAVDTSTGTGLSVTIAGKLFGNYITFDETESNFLVPFNSTASVRAYTLATGTQAWIRTLTCNSGSSVSLNGGTAFVSDLCGWVYSFNAATGALNWSTQIGKGANLSTNLSSPVLANGLIFIGTKGTGDVADSIGRGAFYVLDQATGDVVWTYQEDDLGDVSAIATVTDGIFYNVTSGWDVYAFEVGEGTTSDHLISTYDTYNTFKTDTGLTENKYLESTCTTAGTVSDCTFNNLYTNEVREAQIDFGDNTIISVQLSDGKYHMYVDGSYVYLPTIAASSSEDFTIDSDVGGTYDPTIPVISNIDDGVIVEEASYDPATEDITFNLTGDGMYTVELNNLLPSTPYYFTIQGEEEVALMSGVGGDLSLDLPTGESSASLSLTAAPVESSSSSSSSSHTGKVRFCSGNRTTFCRSYQHFISFFK